MSDKVRISVTASAGQAQGEEKPVVAPQTGMDEVRPHMPGVIVPKGCTCGGAPHFPDCEWWKTERLRLVAQLARET